MQFPATELVLDANGAVYHLGLQPDQLASKIILVGDQDRVSKISRFFDTIEHRIQHREFVSHTGTFQGKRLTVLSTGIGTDNIDICMAELDALVNIDLSTRTEKAIQ
jgi:uridine phosphorylase